MSIGCVAIAGGPQDVVSSSGALWEHQTAETARGRKWCIRYRVTGLRNSVLAISNADWGILSVAVRSSFRSVSTSGTVEIEARSSWCAQRSQFGQICVRAVARASRPWESVESADLTDAPGRRESREATPTRGGPDSAPLETVCLAPLSRCLSVFHHLRNR